MKAVMLFSTGAAAAIGVHDRGAERRGGEPRGEALHDAGGNQRRGRIGRDEHDHGNDVERQRREDRRAPADIVGQRADREQAPSRLST